MKVALSLKELMVKCLKNWSTFEFSLHFHITLSTLDMEIMISLDSTHL